MDFTNVYDDAVRAAAYAKLEFPGTYYLAFRDLPGIIAEHVHGTRALDFGCGAGRSTRFLRRLGFETVGVDVSEPMLAQARAIDSTGEYRLVPDDDLSGLEAGAFDLILAAFTFDNIPLAAKKISLLSGLKHVLNADGKIVNLVSSPAIYVNEWASFSTKDYRQNRRARNGDKVRILMLDVEDKRPVEDILWTEEGWRDVYERAGLKVIKVYKPLGVEGEGYTWISETVVAPWTIYVLGVRR
ncbi:MAG: class I SAM-dependent methyltransferase [Candidatus Eremiobacteraeota bacterium]|nr:class I SAM-dependent methyltransferase [Candidatus Eremiobacteraeota bacterium]